MGEGLGRRGLFADMLAGEPALLADAAEVFATADQQAAAARGRSLGGVFDLRVQDLITEFAGTVRKLKPVPGQRYTDVNDERILGRLTALLFVSSELPEHLPTPTLSWFLNMLGRGPIGYLDGLVAMLGTTQNERAQAVRTLLESAARTAVRGTDLQSSLYVSLSCRLRDVCRDLARRVLDEQPEAYDLDQQRQQANLLSAHVLYTFGQAPDDLPLALKLLANEERIGTVSARPEDNNNPNASAAPLATVQTGVNWPAPLLAASSQIDSGALATEIVLSPIGRNQIPAQMRLHRQTRWENETAKVNGWRRASPTRRAGHVYRPFDGARPSGFPASRLGSSTHRNSLGSVRPGRARA